MIKEIKDLTAAALIEAGLAEGVIARTKKAEVDLKTSGKNTYASMITGTGRYTDPMGREAVITIDEERKLLKVRTRRQLPLVVTITGRSEEEVDILFSDFITALPDFFTLDNRQGFIEPEMEEHSDFDAALDNRYSSVVRILFSVDVGLTQSGLPLSEPSSLEGDLEHE